jgi:antitoxin HigA-1
MTKSPFHPGEYLRDFLSDYKITQSHLAKHIGVRVGVINQICREKRGISPAMSQKLGQAFKMSPEFWLKLQQAYELNQVKPDKKIKPLPEVA